MALLAIASTAIGAEGTSKGLFSNIVHNAVISLLHRLISASIILICALKNKTLERRVLLFTVFMVFNAF